MKVVLVRASWCAPCKALKLYAEKNGLEFDESLDMDDSENSEFIKKHNVRSVPTVIAMEDNELVKSFSGFQPESLKEIFKLRDN